MCQGRAVVAEKLVPQSILALLIMEHITADIDQNVKQFFFCWSFPAPHHGGEAVKAVQIA